MRALKHLMAVGVLAGLTLGGPARAQSPELKKVHILMVFDTNAKELAKSLRIDKKRMSLLWKETIPEKRKSVEILEGEEATKEKILDYYEKLQVQKNEGLVFYYAGHGATDKDTKKHVFDLRKGPRLYRDELTKVMESKKAEMVLLLTDCCSTPQEFKEDDEDLTLKRDFRPVKVPDRVQPTVRCLLFQSRGTVDITAATDNASWSDNINGGIFTRSVHRMLRAPLDVLDGNKDRFITWREFYPQLRSETHYLFGEWRSEMLSRGEKVDERKQVPHAFQLGKVFAVIGIENLTRKVVEYECRWPGEAEWTKIKLNAGEKKLHTFPVKETDTPLPVLEAKFSFRSEPMKLATREYSGSSEPTRLADKYYRSIRPKN